MSATKEKANTSFEFPAGLRVLLVDDDSTCLNVVAKMLQICKYEVTKCSRAKEALSILREGGSKFDIVISDVHMPEMNGFELLEIISLEMDLPVIMISSNDENHVVMKGIIDGACDYLIKPVRMEAIKFIWKHVIRKQTNNLKALKQSEHVENSEILNRKLWDSESHLASVDNENGGISTCRKDEEEEGKEKDEAVSVKKPRMVWTAELHQQFVAAVNEIGPRNAVPKKILEAMNVPGLTRENVASHLQKYRLYLRRMEEDSPHHQNNFPHLPSHSREVNPELASSFHNYNIQRQVASAQPQFQSLPVQQQVSDPVFAGGNIPLADQRNFSGFGLPKTRFENFESQQQINRSQGSNLSSRVLMESNDLIPLNQFGNEFQGNSASSFAMERPLKMQRLDESARIESLNNREMCNSVSLSSAAVDFSKLSENRFCPQNRVMHGGNGNLWYNPNPSYEPAPFGEHFDQDDFNIRLFDEQFVVGAADGIFDFDGSTMDWLAIKERCKELAGDEFFSSLELTDKANHYLHSLLPKSKDQRH